MNSEIKKLIQKQFPELVESAVDDDELWVGLAECFEDVLNESGTAAEFEDWQDAMDNVPFPIAACEIPADYWFDFESAWENARDNYEQEDEDEEEDYEALDYEVDFE